MQENTNINGAHDGNSDSNGVTGSCQLRVAIIGGGIVGVAMALGLLRRNMAVRLYEQAGNFREIGAGVAFTTNAQTCMALLSPDILAAMKAVSTKNESPYYTYVDGYRCGPDQTDDDNDMRETQLYQLHAGTTGFDACHRAHFLDEMVKHMPEGVVAFRKRFETYAFDEDLEEFTLRFEDGSTATADVVIGCDGIKSRVRQVLLGEDNPASYPGFAHQVAFRGLVSMERAVATLGKDKAHNQCMHTGPGAHLLNFPVAQHTLMNVVAFAPAPGDWVHERMVAPAGEDELPAAFAGWRPAVRAIVGLLQELEEGRLDKWAIFDTYEHPAPTYASGGVCIAGDAAHATSPHHGAGAGMGIEDALALATVLDLAAKTMQGGDGSKTKRATVAAALAAYDAVRRERTQWLVRSSREVSKTQQVGCQVLSHQPQDGISEVIIVKCPVEG
ncbi:uncharacterized protein THITE_2142620 [Thermothielavioides terrestris NRRL 8126]|uniref:FAD-binding domain-containing protein n=1 Tax=Thermothielavioides terrestris (strain ATCC 38088 / NRRL 8126) TaxID=578455 RepID=G2QX49_THETT|nr:uncharacterized protein THITE_2142620 [Thermothielavioides terrestris NRRL 8126]AEO64816.1 hypothetical protein THITE_2142620 [Thermothielavioides terrestris NRRL 8126]